MSDCIFCKIVAGEIPCYKIWENEEFIAFLDIFPTCEGQTLLIPKEHHDSDILADTKEFVSKIFTASKQVATLLKKELDVERVGLVVEGLEVPHAHVKLYPFFNEKGFGGKTSSNQQEKAENLQKTQQKILEK